MTARSCKLEDIEQIVGDLFTLLTAAGMVTPKEELDSGIKGYQVSASPIRFRAGDGTSAYHDPLRIPRPPVGGLRTNPFFVDFYRGGPELLQGLEAREHTAQVASDKREDREDAFREGRLPVLYCSPTMELGVDIKELDVVVFATSLRALRTTLSAAAGRVVADSLRSSSRTARPGARTTSTSSVHPSAWSRAS